MAGSSSWEVARRSLRAGLRLRGDSIQTFDAFRPTGPLNKGRIGAAAALLHDGRVLVLGGVGTFAYDDERPVAIRSRAPRSMSPRTGVFTLVGPMASLRGGTTATTLDDGRVLVAGGHGDFDSQNTFNSESLASAELFSASAPQGEQGR